MRLPGTTQIRLPNSAHTARPWRIHQVAPDFRLEDVWRLPGRGGPDDFPELVQVIADMDPSASSSRAVRALFAIRWKLGELLGWDAEDTGLDSRVSTLRDRLPADLREGPTGPEAADLPFTPLYLTDDEWAAEVANQTVHGILHLGRIPDGPDAFRVQMAVLVKPNGLFGTAYMAAIAPFRHLIVYPVLMREGAAAWESRLGAGARSARSVRQARLGSVPDRLHFTDSNEANELIATDPMALLVGFALDQQVTVQKAFMGPLVLKERLGALDAETLASADLEPAFRAKPAIHRFPGAMAERVHELAAHVRDRYDGEAARVWTDAGDAEALRANIADLPGFGEMKIKALGSVLAKRFGVDAAEALVPWHPTLGDVDTPQALADYQEAKRVHKAEWSKARARA